MGALQLSEDNNPLPGAMFVVCAVVLYFAPNLSAGALQKANRHHGRIRVTLDDEGVRVTGAHADIRTAWSNYGSYAESGRVFILRSPDRLGNCAMVLVKRGAAELYDVDRLRTLLDRHLPRV
ncbi:hypothetical protein ACFZAV_06675 [Streptomyces sp. NPDC008343]|uniref:hypothetical protein n=1 Tax=Streptomyces sp. NPDC008343 TaxID=3364828 RepID=UPI0036EE4BF4